MSQRELRKKIYWTLASLAVVILAFLSSVIFLNPTSVGSPDFVENINLWAVIWAFNFIVVLTLSFFLARNLIKLFFEYQTRQPGSRIKSKLITTFVIFSMFPALIMSFLAFGLINRNLRLWFTSPSEQLLRSSQLITSNFYEQNRSYAILAARWMATELEVRNLKPGPELEKIRQAAGFAGLVIFDGKGREVERVGKWLGESGGLAFSLSKVLAGADFSLRRRLLDVGLADRDLVLVGVPVSHPSGAIQGALFGQLVIPQSVEFHAIQVKEALEKYKQLKAGADQVELNYFSILVLTTLTVVFGFVWLGTYIARRITVPLEALAEGARELAEGNLDHRVDVSAADELGVLVESFNQMAEEIKQSRHQLEKANEELRATNVELDERRRYTETVLQNIATGVISVDESDVIRTVNDAALHMFQTTREKILNQPLSQLGERNLRAEFQKMKSRAGLGGTFSKDIALKREEQQLYVAATVTANPLPLQNKTEYLLVLDDLTELIKAEKFAAWQEVARRLAHEIKNPLTPIQLSAERIRKRFERIQEDRVLPAQLREFSQVLNDAVRIITAEAEMLKTLVNEFSSFARLPISHPTETDLHPLITQTLAGYDGGLQTVEIRKRFDPRIGRIRVDPEQMRRVFVNLIDNSLDALSSCKGDRHIEISTRLNEGGQSVTIEFSDNGIGISPQDYDNLFLPYFSTKRKGTGLGLAIVRQIISEHNGHIRAQMNRARGMKFIMEIPLA
ncbi:MAG: ATP-binding protein [Acidobacteriota bacterium]